MALCENWCTTEDLCCDSTKYTALEIEEAILGASQILSRSSYNKYGVCEYTVAPCTSSCSRPCYDKSCQGYAVKPQIRPGSPIIEVTEINVYDEDGNAVSNDYLDLIWWEYDTIYFPADFDFPDQEPGAIGAPSTWNIVFTAGVPVPVLGKKAAIQLANALLDPECDVECKLPPDLKTVSRDGSTFEIIGSQETLARLSRVSFFLDRYCQKRRWSGVVSPLNFQTQLVQ